MRNRSLVVLIAVFLSVVGASALSAQPYTMESVPKLVATWFDEFYKGVQKAGTDFNVTVSQQAPAAADPAQQVRLIEDAVNAGNNAILVVPNDAKSIEPVLARARAQKIVTITHESPNQKNADLDIEMIDNKAFGRKAMELMVQGMGATSGEFVVFVGSLTVPAHNIWADAALALAKQKYPGLKEVASRYPVSEDQNAARDAALSIITAHPNIKAFLTFGSQGGPGAAQALRQKGLIGKITVIATTAPSQAAEYLKDGSMYASVLWDPAEAGYAMIYLSKLILDGKKAMITKDLDIPTLGKPYSMSANTIVYDRPLVVTKDNVDQYAGF